MLTKRKNKFCIYYDEGKAKRNDTYSFLIIIQEVKNALFCDFSSTLPG